MRDVVRRYDKSNARQAKKFNRAIYTCTKLNFIYHILNNEYYMC